MQGGDGAKHQESELTDDQVYTTTLEFNVGKINEKVKRKKSLKPLNDLNGLMFVLSAQADASLLSGPTVTRTTRCSLQVQVCSCGCQILQKDNNSKRLSGGCGCPFMWLLAVCWSPAPGWFTPQQQIHNPNKPQKTNYVRLTLSAYQRGEPEREDGDHRGRRVSVLSVCGLDVDLHCGGVGDQAVGVEGGSEIYVWRRRRKRWKSLTVNFHFGQYVLFYFMIRSIIIGAKMTPPCGHHHVKYLFYTCWQVHLVWTKVMQKVQFKK